VCITHLVLFTKSGWKKLGQIFRQAVDVVNDGVVVLTKDAFDAGTSMRIQRPPLGGYGEPGCGVLPDLASLVYCTA
jgi:hypothetical protein